MAVTAPPTAIDGTPIASAHVNILRDNDNWFGGLLQNPTAAGQVPISTTLSEAVYGFLAPANITDGSVGTNQIADGAVGILQTTAGAVDLTIIAASLLATLVPSALGAWVRTAAEIPSGWARETNLDGRFAVGAGTSYGVTFVEETNYGSTWTHAHVMSSAGAAVFGPESASDAVNFLSGGGSAATTPTHPHALTGSVDNTTWVVPSRAYVACRMT